ncbi:MAG: DUF4416 family protein [Candidatus Omnitrophica bacterium]|nr:DUF4416 family protein [Candidatus Omnitrophota bacterium]MCM8810520.1 DUF4416 family protein [Candidatus Omnitrophota bacterium]
MGKIKSIYPVKIFCGLIYREDIIVEQSKEKLIEKWGEIDIEEGPFLFDFTDYYEGEMGKDLKRKFVSFENLYFPENVYEWKIYTNQIEEMFTEQDKRKINIDPGYIDNSKVILLSTKDYYHRIYIGKGIFAEVTLYYSKGKYNFLNWTYPDYRSENYMNFFLRMREKYRQQVKQRQDEKNVDKDTD